MPANTVPDPFVTVTGYVRRSVRDRFAEVVRLEGLSIAAVIRSFVEANSGGEISPAPKGGSAQKLNLRLRDGVRAKLREVAAARGSTPSAYATALLEAHMMGQPQWSAEQLAELRATRRLVAEVRDKLEGEAAADRVEASLALIDQAISKNVAYWGVKASGGAVVQAHREPAPGRARQAPGAALRRR